MAHVLPIDQSSADQKAARIQDALQALRAAHEIDERDDALDVASLTAWYEQTIPTVKDIKILSGAIAVELEARYGALVKQEGERRGGNRSASKVSRRETLLPNSAEKLRRHKARALAAQPEARTHYVKTESEAGRKPSIKGALRAVKHASSPPTPTAKPSTRSMTAFADSVRTEVRGRIEAVADQALTLDELAKHWKVHTDIARRYLREAALVATVTEDNRRYTITLTQEVAEIVTMRNWFRTLRAEITRRRLENHDNRQVRRWNPMASSQHEFRRLLNWIEEQLDHASGSLQ